MYAPHIGRQHPRVLLQLLDALVAKPKLLAVLSILQLERRVFAQQLPVHSDQLLQALLQRAHV